MHLAWMLAKSGRAKEGVELIETVVTDARKNLLKKPGVVAAQRRLAVTSQVKAKILLLSGQSIAACDAARYSYSQWQATQKLGGLLEMDRLDPGTIPALATMLKPCGVTATF